MKILHVPYCYFPDAAGGTEVYVQALAREQKTRGIEVEIAAPGTSNLTYQNDGITVRRFATSSKLTLSELYAEGDPVAARSFEQYALAGEPDIVHLHSYTAAVSARLIRRLKASGAQVVFTFHTPSVTCVRGDLLFFGQQVCDGEMRGRDCCACGLESLGLNRSVSRTLADLPVTISRLATHSFGRLSGKARTLFEMRRLIDQRNSSVCEFLEQADQIVAVCEWIRRLLLRNGVPDSKITLARQGLPHPAVVAKQRRGPTTNPLRIVFMGRLHKTKGIEFLAEAVTRAGADATLDIYGTVQGSHGEAIHARLSDVAAKSARIKLCSPVPPERVVETFANYHVAAVPSHCFETGPLVIYEAFAAGLPVLGSNLGGIAELVSHGKDGMLLPHDRLADWVRAIELLANSPAIVDRLAMNVEKPRTMVQVADDMTGVYSKLARCVDLRVQ